MSGTGWTEAAAAAAAFVIALPTAPAGISGAVLLLPFQVDILGTPSPAVTPTNLVYNVVATPGALYRYRRQGQAGGSLALVLIAGALPGVIAGSVIRVELPPGPRAFDLVIATVLLPLGAWLTLTGPASQAKASGSARKIPGPALASTFVTSAAGVITFIILSAQQHASAAPDWPTGIALGAGGPAGAYAGARIQSSRLMTQLGGEPVGTGKRSQIGPASFSTGTRRQRVAVQVQRQRGHPGEPLEGQRANRDLLRGEFSAPGERERRYIDGLRGHGKASITQAVNNTSRLYATLVNGSFNGGMASILWMNSIPMPRHS